METGLADLSQIPASTHVQVVAAIKTVKPGLKYVLQIGSDPLVTEYLLGTGSEIVSLDPEENVERLAKLGVQRPFPLKGPWSGVGFLVEMSRHVTREQIQQAAKEETDVVVGRHVQMLILDEAGRWLQAQVAMAMDCAKIIVCHDTNDKNLWGKLEIGPGWKMIEIRDYATWTGVLTRDESMVGLLAQKFSAVTVLDTFEGKEWIS